MTQGDVLIHGGGTTGRCWDRVLPHPDGPALRSEEHDPEVGRMLGDVPRAFAHLGLVISAANRSLGAAGPFGDQLRSDDDG